MEHIYFPLWVPYKRSILTRCWNRNPMSSSCCPSKTASADSYTLAAAFVGRGRFLRKVSPSWKVPLLTLSVFHCTKYWVILWWDSFFWISKKWYQKNLSCPCVQLCKWTIVGCHFGVASYLARSTCTYVSRHLQQPAKCELSVQMSNMYAYSIWNAS